MEKVSVDMSLRPVCYTGHPESINVNPFDPEIHKVPGVYLEHQEGCGYDIFELTPAEARAVADALIKAAYWAEKQKWGNPKYG